MLRKSFTMLLVLVFSVIFNWHSSIAAGVIKIGVQAPITGDFASDGQSMVDGIKLVANQYNEKGGILGKKIQIITCDDAGKAAEAATCGRQFVGERVLAVIGSYTSTCTESPEPIYYRAGILQFSPATAADLVKKGYWTFFRSSVPDTEQAYATAKFLMRFKRIALITDYSAFSMGLTKGVYDDLKKLGKGNNVVYFGKIVSGSQNFTSILTSIKSHNPDVIYFGGMYNDGGLIRNQMVQLGIRAAFVGGDGNDTQEFIKLAGKAAPGSYLIDVPIPEDLPYPEAKRFLNDFKATYHKSPADIWTLYDVDGFRVLLYAIEQTHSFDAKEIANYLHTSNLAGFKGITGPMRFSKDGERIGGNFLVYKLGEDLKWHKFY
jgi:branched-chain amino acid transport system substrate-binding protein